MLACVVVLLATSGCALIIPDVSHEPVIHNPFPQLSKVAVAPFFNQSDERTVDGRKFALAYFAELQAVPGFEVVPLGVVEEAILEQQVDLSRPGEARRLAKILGVDAVVVGSVTDFTPYYPPRCGLRVEWYAANPGFHEIPPGYGLPWGTPEEEFIPAPLVFESEFALAKAQLATQTPACERHSVDPPALPPQPVEPAPFPGAPFEQPAEKDAGKNDLRGIGAPSRAVMPPSLRPRPRAAAIAAPSPKQIMKSPATSKSCRRALALRVRRRHRCNRSRLPPVIRPLRSVRTFRCRRVGPTNAASSRRRQAPCARCVAPRMVRL